LPAGQRNALVEVNIGFLLGLAAIASTTLSNMLAARVTISI
jgi:hypothetical protein